MSYIQNKNMSDNKYDMQSKFSGKQRLNLCSKMWDHLLLVVCGRLTVEWLKPVCSNWQRKKSFSTDLTGHNVDSALDVLNVTLNVMCDNFRPALAIVLVHEQWRQHLTHFGHYDTVSSAAVSDKTWMSDIPIPPVIDWLSSVLRPLQHSIGYIRDGTIPPDT